MARAPGRLDVMGGIADYSGSLVMQVGSMGVGGEGGGGLGRRASRSCGEPDAALCGLGTWCVCASVLPAWCVRNTPTHLGRAPLRLQMPIAEACHVAVQRHAASDQPPRLRILSFRHGAAFEADLSELVGMLGWRAGQQTISP